MANPQERAWQAGYTVGKRGKPITLCPYAKGGLMLAWQEGWRNGQGARTDAPA